MSTFSLINISELNKTLLEIQRLSDNGESPTEVRDEGIALLKNFSKGTTSSGKPKFTGTLSNMDEVKFNVWSNSSAYEYFEQLDASTSSHVVWIHYTLSKYGLVIDNIINVEGYDPDAFIYHKYSSKEKASEFIASLKESGISSAAMSVIRTVLHMDYSDFVSNRIVKEYAAYSHHDNCPTGLLAHMTKCIQIYNGIKETYSFLQDEETNDLMVISLTLHDIGKIYEMKDGVYQRFSFLTHRGLGLEHLLEYKAFIVNLYSEEFFYMLCSVLLQHHGEYGEHPRTLYSLLVHMIDDMEAQLTSIDDIVQKEAVTVDTAGTKLKYNGSYLNISSDIFLQNS